MELFVSAPRGVESLLARELTELGVPGAVAKGAGVYVEATLEQAYRVLIGSRLASRVMLPVASGPAVDAASLYALARSVRWNDHLDPAGTFSVSATQQGTTHKSPQGAALKVKDAIVDVFRDATGARPSVDTTAPDVRVHVHLSPELVTLSIDLAGDGLHRRGYRGLTGAAPLKENLAAAVLARAGWSELCRQDTPLLDPMCGSGTFLIEAAHWALDVAPGLSRERWGFARWRGNNVSLWQQVRAEAHEKARAGRERAKHLWIRGCDLDARAITTAIDNIERAGLTGIVHVERRALSQLSRPHELGERTGLVVSNPPYGERLGDPTQVAALYAELGATLKRELHGWRACLLVPQGELAHELGLRADTKHSMANGPLDCWVLQFDLAPPRAAAELVSAAATRASSFVNRLKKNRKELGKWAAREGIECYRIYDGDVPEYAVAVDLYGDHAHVQEYAPPKTIDPVTARGRFRDVMTVVPSVLELPAENVAFKVREKKSGTSQYEKQADTRHYFIVNEGAARLWVNLEDYLDTGLFLDHRPLRMRLGELARGKRFLNLFCYTAAATVHAALGGASRTVSVDLSNTYLDWAEKNFAANRLDEAAHRLVRADCFTYLAEARETFDLIFLDPPAFSNSKSMDRVLDVQRDHVELIDGAMQLLARGGSLFFSTNLRKFKLDEAALAERYEVRDVTANTIPKDFARNARIHVCFEVRWRG